VGRILIWFVENVAGKKHYNNEMLDGSLEKVEIAHRNFWLERKMCNLHSTANLQVDTC